MIRPIRLALLTLALVALVGISFAVGQSLRRVAVGPLEIRTQITSLPEAGIGNTGASAHAADFQDDVNPDETFREVLRYVKSDYVDRISDDKKLGFGAVKTMLMALDDPKTRFYDPKQRAQLIDQLNGKFNGIGATLAVVKQNKPSGDPKNPIEERRLAIVAPAPGGPADKAGLRPGDIITEIDGHWIIAYDPRLDLDQMRENADPNSKEYRAKFKELTDKLTKGTSLPKALDQLSTPTGTTLTLTVERPGAAQPLKVQVATAATTVTPVEFKPLNDHVAYLRVTEFNDQATDLFTRALAGAKQTSLVLDLRDNAGGPVTGTDHGALASAKALLAHLTPGGTVGTVIRKGNKAEPITVEPAAPNATKYKVVVLVNGGTANLAELVASALKERDGAKLVGSRTFGDGVYQKLVNLQDDAGMTLTAGKFQTASGHNFGSVGLTPDIAMKTGGPHASDAAVEKAVSALASA